MNLQVDFSKRKGRIKPMHAVNNMPTCPGDPYGLYRKFTEASIPYARLHDTGGCYGGARYVDIENIFPDFDADENDPASYDFSFTDVLLENMVNAGVKPFYRLGATIENNHRIRAYHIYPPKDNEKWARICEHIILHYNEGWADGYRFGIEYWEIWNEPDNEPVIEDNPMWKGTAQQYFELYHTAAVYLKEKFPHLKIGGYASCGFYALLEKDFSETAHSSTRTGYFVEFFLDFLRFISERNTPLDFFSWHSYADLDSNVYFASYAKQKLTEYGYGSAEVIFNEWNPGILLRSTAEDAANIAAMMCAMHGTSTDMAMYYDGQMDSSYCGIFDPVHHTVFKAYSAFSAFGELYRLGNETEARCGLPKVYVCAAADAENGAVLLVNKTGEDVAVTSSLLGEVSVIATDEVHFADELTVSGEHFTLPKNAVWLIKKKLTD